MDRLHVCIVERNLFVSQDMMLSLNSVLPSAVCSVHTTVAEARTSSRSGSEPRLVLISADADGTFSMSRDDARWLVDDKVIAFDARDRVSHPEWVHLNKPFAEEELTSAVRQLVVDRADEKPSLGYG